MKYFKKKYLSNLNFINTYYIYTVNVAPEKRYM